MWRNSNELHLIDIVYLEEGIVDEYVEEFEMLATQMPSFLMINILFFLRQLLKDILLVSNPNARYKTYVSHGGRRIIQGAVASVL